MNAQTDSLTYKAAGVNVDENNEANTRIAAHVKRTRNNRVVTKEGLFGGGLSLEEFKEKENPVLVGSLGYHTGDSTCSENLARLVTIHAHSKMLHGAEPIAFMDYIAATQLPAIDAEKLVRGFANTLTADSPVIPLIGGETAEMPSVFEPGKWEVVGALYAITEKTRARRVEHVDLSPIKEYSRPVLVLSMDGVGTKTKIGVEMKKAKGRVKDITHHSLNDILCQGAKGIALMPYMGCHTKDPHIIRQLTEGMQECSKENNLTLLDMVVVENPRLYLPGQYDVCATIAGLVDLDKLVTGTAIKKGDLVIGLASDGLHTNGFSLARKAVERAGKKYSDFSKELGCKIGDALLVPHRDYSRSVYPILENEQGLIKGIAHITGGGMQDNIVRVIPEGLGVDIQRGSWKVLKIFEAIQYMGNVPLSDPENKGMLETFNMGVGMALIVDKSQEPHLRKQLEKSGETVYKIGKVVNNDGQTAYERIQFVR
jgi:phosphoribosylformylglycinamidine cyclo-ligase